MTSLDFSSTLPARESRMWKNYKVCLVRDADTMWICELPSANSSTERKKFRHFEKHLNNFFKKAFNELPENIPNDETEKIVIVFHDGQYYRGKIESITSQKRNQIVQVFLLDYGTVLRIDGSCVRVLEPGSWTSVPFQAKLIKLFAISPLTLRYSPTKTLKLLPGKSSEWDAAATNFVQNVFEHKHSVNFVPVKYDSDGCLHGLLTVSMNLSEWASVLQSCTSLLPELLEITTKQSTSSKSEKFEKDLAQILVHLNFANYEREVLEDFARNKCGVQGLPSLQIGYRSDGRLKYQLSDSKTQDSNNEEKEQRAVEVKEACEAISGKCKYDERVSSGSSSKFAHGIFKYIHKNPRLDDEFNDVGSSLGSMSISSSPSSLDPSSKNSSFELHDTAVGAVEIAKQEQGNTEKEVMDFLTKHIHFKNTLEKNSTLPVVLDIQVSEIPEKTKPVRYLPVRSISSPHDKEKENSSDCSALAHLHDSNSLEKKFGRSQDEFLSPFEGMTCSRKSSLLEGVTVMPPLDVNCGGLSCDRVNTKKQQVAPCYSKVSSDVSLDRTSINHGKVLTDAVNGSLCRSMKSGAEIEKAILDIEENVALTPVPQKEHSVPKWVCTQLMKELQSSELNNTSCRSNDDVCAPTDMLEFSGNNKIGVNLSESVAVNTSSNSRQCVKACDFSLEKEISEEMNDLAMDKGQPSKFCSENCNDSVCHTKYNALQRREKEIINNSVLAAAINCNGHELGVEDHMTTSDELNASFMSDARDIWTKEKASDLVEGEFSSLVLHNNGPNIAKLFRVYVSGEVIPDEKVIVNTEMMYASLNAQVAQILKKAGMKATRLQAYAWPSVCSGSSTVIVGDRFSGKTYGYMVPIISAVVDQWQFITKRLAPGFGAVLVVVCNDWQRAKSAANSLVDILPNTLASLKIMTAWGGCGCKEEMATKAQLLAGCDILITTPPCLVRLLTGKAIGYGKESNTELQDLPSTSLNRCVYFVIDDVDLSLNHFADEIKQLLKWWAEGQQSYQKQIVLTSSSWTPMLRSLISNLSCALTPRIIISSPVEAAVCSRVRTCIHHVREAHDALSTVAHLITENFRNRKCLVFVNDEQEITVLKGFLEAAAVHVVFVSGKIDMGQLCHIVNQWHEIQALTMIVYEKSVYHLLHHNLANADAIFHPYLPKSMSTFMLRYAFMVENFSTDFINPDSKCESHVVLTDDIVASSNEVIWELTRICQAIPQSVMTLPLVETRAKASKALCYYFKAYGRCPEKLQCKFRHDVKYSDIPHELPRYGEVTLNIVRIINASRFLVRINEYSEGGNLPKTSLDFHYLKLFCALQRHYGDKSNHRQLECPRIGTFCVVKNKGNWARAKIDNINYKKDKVYIVVFLIDEGSEITVELTSALVIHPKFLRIPGLIVEAYLCCVKPVDHDTEWTFHASHYVNEICSNHGKNSKFLGRIILALNFTLWLSPVVEVLRVGRDTVQRGSLRSRLITGGYGGDNKEHMSILKEQCAKAGISLEKKDLDNRAWLTWLENAENLLNECSLQDKIIKDVLTINVGMNESDEVSPVVQMPGVNIVAAEELPLHKNIEIKVAFVESFDCFYIQSVDRRDSLEALEEDIAQLTEDWTVEAAELAVDTPKIDVPTASYCLARFTDDRYYRGRVVSNEPGNMVKVFFIDYGETLVLSCSHVQPCPENIIKRIPAQAIPCHLAHVTVTEAFQHKAVEYIDTMANTFDVWKLKAVGVTDYGKGKIYIVELEFDDPPRQMWTELVREGIALQEGKDLEECLENVQHAHSSAVDSKHIDLKDNPIEEQPEYKTCSTDYVELVSDSTDSSYRQNSSSPNPQKRSPTLVKEEERGQTTVNHKKLTTSLQEFNDLCLHAPQLQAIDGVTPKLNPETSWNQNKDQIILKMYLIGVLMYRCRISTSRLVFKTLLGDKFYVVDEELEGEVDPDQSWIEVKGTAVIIRLWKEPQQLWQLPFAKSCRRKWLRAEIQGPDSDEEDSNIIDHECIEWPSPDSSDAEALGGLPGGISDGSIPSSGSNSDCDEMNLAIS